MVKRSYRQIIFFSLIFLIYFLSVKAGEYWIANSENLNKDLSCIVVGLGYTTIIVGLYFLAKLDPSSEGFWDITPAATCKGGSYMWQGDSPSAKVCQELASTSDGRAMIGSYNCPKGQIGVPHIPFEYTPLSDDNWQDQRVMDIPGEPLKDNPSMTSLRSQMQN